MAGDKKNEYCRCEKDLQKEYCTPMLLFIQKARERDTRSSEHSSASWDSSSDKTEFSDFWLYVERKRRIKSSVCPTTLSLYNRHVSTESAVQSLGLHNDFSVCKCMNCSKMLRVVCDIECTPKITATDYIRILVRDTEYTSILASDTKQSVHICTQVSRLL